MMTEQSAKFILTVLELSMSYHKREASSDAKAVDASRKITERYDELTSSLGFDGAMKQAKAEFLMEVDLMLT
jgi:hypothetical protein